MKTVPPFIPCPPPYDDFKTSNELTIFKFNCHPMESFFLEKILIRDEEGWGGGGWGGGVEVEKTCDLSVSF